MTGYVQHTSPNFLAILWISLTVTKQFAEAVRVLTVDLTVIVVTNGVDDDDDGQIDNIKLTFDTNMQSCAYDASDWGVDAAGEMNLSITGINAARPKPRKAFKVFIKRNTG